MGSPLKPSCDLRRGAEAIPTGSVLQDLDVVMEYGGSELGFVLEGSVLERQATKIMLYR